MTWIKLAADFYLHPKIVQVGERAAWVYVIGLCYATEHETDGHLTAAVLRLLMPRTPRRTETVRLLCGARLWHEEEDGVRIHNFGEWQRTKSQNQADTRHFSPNGESDLVQLPLPDLGMARAGARTHGGARGHAGAQEQNREEKRTPPDPPRGGESTPITGYTMGGHRQRERKAYAEDCVAYAVEHDLEPRAVHQAVYYGRARTLEEVKAFVAEHWSGDG
jgi:hypothetical protein